MGLLPCLCSASSMVPYRATSSTHHLVEPLNPRGCLQVFVVFDLSKASDRTDSSLSVKLTFTGSHETSGSSPVL